MATRRSGSKQTGESTPFNNTGTDLISTETGPAIRELAAAVGASASPGFSFGRSSNVNVNTWLLTTGSVPSNKAGITVALNNPEITQIYIANEDISTFDISIYEHEGDEINLTLLDTVSVVSKRSDTFDLAVSVTSGRQLAARVTSGSAKNVNVGLQLKGNI